MEDRLTKIVKDSLVRHIDDIGSLAENMARDLLANGVIVPPPVKIGDTLFFIMKDGKIYSGQVYYLRWESHKNYGVHSDISASVGAYSSVGASFEDFGKTVFFTKEEAERALVKMNQT